MKYRNKFAWIGALFAAGAMVGAVACGGDDSSGPGPKPDGGQDSGPQPDGGQDSGPTPANKKTGVVSVVSSKTTGSSFYLATASFTDATGADAGVSCTTATDGACTIVKCGKPVGAPLDVSAGDIDISGGKKDVKLPVGADNKYKLVNDQGGELFEGGEDINIAAAGASPGVGTFSQVLKAPSIVDVTKPAINGSSIEIDRSQDLEIDWTPPATGIGDVYAGISAAASDQSNTSIRCSAAIDAKKITIPKTVLANIPDNSVGGAFTVGAVSKNEATRSDYDVTLTLTSSATRNNGADDVIVTATFK